MFNPSSQDVRRFFCQTWAKHRAQHLLTALETLAKDWILEHPEYHPDLEDEAEALVRNYAIEQGRTNPFLHLSMHLSISEQVSIDQPAGIRRACEALADKAGDLHDAHHQMMDCLGEMLWTAQRQKSPPDPNQYLDCVQRKLR
jgi:hypothetical protein